MGTDHRGRGIADNHSNNYKLNWGFNRFNGEVNVRAGNTENLSEWPGSTTYSAHVTSVPGKDAQYGPYYVNNVKRHSTDDISEEGTTEELTKPGVTKNKMFRTQKRAQNYAQAMVNRSERGNKPLPGY